MTNAHRHGIAALRSTEYCVQGIAHQGCIELTRYSARLPPGLRCPVVFRPGHVQRRAQSPLRLHSNLLLGNSLTCHSTVAACFVIFRGKYFLNFNDFRIPVFRHGQFRKGVELSHTHLTLLADQDGNIYDVAIDNVFASGYAAHTTAVPAPLNSIRVKDRLDLCGQLYTKGVGMHWVHTNCGVRPSAGKPDGWLKKLAPDGSASQNYLGNRQYCARF